MTSTSMPLIANDLENSLGSVYGSRSYQSLTSGVFFHAKPPLMPTVSHVEALDHRSTKLRIPLSAVEPTKALEDDGLVPGICRLYLEGRCRQGSRCFQVHVGGAVLESLRKEALETPSCCYLHGAPCNFEGLPLNLTVNVGGKLIGFHSLCPTNYLWSMYSKHGDNQLIVKRARVCREHRRGLCRFGEECGFLHVCRELVLDGDDPAGGTFPPAPHGDVGGVSPHFCGPPPEELRAAARSLHACSPAATSLNNSHPCGGAITPHGISFAGGENGVGSLSSASRSRPSFGFYGARHAISCESDGDGRSFRAPLLCPLGGNYPPRGPTSQRHNPYADSPFFC